LLLKKLKSKWGIHSNWQLVIILIVFAITGSSSAYLSKPLLLYLNISPDSFEDFFLGNLWYWLLRILIVFPIYQVVLLLIGALFFQFRFFWNFEKKILMRIGFKRFLS